MRYGARSILKMQNVEDLEHVLWDTLLDETENVTEDNHIAINGKRYSLHIADIPDRYYRELYLEQAYKMLTKQFEDK